MDHVSGTLWPYVVVVLIGFLPSEIWRLLGVLFSRGLAPESEVLEWVRAVATALLAAVVAKLLVSPSGALMAVPLASRFASLFVGIAGYLLVRRSVIAGVIVGEATLMTLTVLSAG